MTTYQREPNRTSSGLVSLRYGDTADSQVLKEDGLFEGVQGALPSVSNESLEARLRQNSRRGNETAAPTYAAKPKAAFQPSTKTEQQLLAEADSDDSDGFNEEE